MTINWKYCQKNSDLILASGLKSLTKQTMISFNDSHYEGYGNYLISDKWKKWNYIGEAKNISIRIKQHSKEKTSTFYKNYKKFENFYINYPVGLKINDFKIREVQTNIGRKELEEFGIVNIPAILNKFQKGKRRIYSGKVDNKVWNEVQNNFIELLEQGEKELMKLNSYEWLKPKIYDKPGLYWIEHKTKGLIYIGETTNLLKRYLTHSERTYFSALRRNIGVNIFGFQLQTINGRKRYFSNIENIKISEFLRNCKIKILEISFGRYELEEFLIKKHKPILNRKNNK